MPPSPTEAIDESIAEVFATLDADPRLVKRSMSILRRWSQSPGLGFPQIFDEDAENAGLYRFFSNRRITFPLLLEPIAMKAMEGLRKAREPLVLHDTTEFAFTGEKQRDGIGRLNKNSQGFLAHIALAVDGSGTRRPLGVVGAELYTRAPKPKGRRENPTSIPCWRTSSVTAASA